MTKFKEWPDATIDVLVGGTPCQSFSIAGLRKGLDDPRGNLMLTYLAIASRYRPKWLVWENVPGVLSSNVGLDFASLLRGMDECGYGIAYRVLDAQYFGVPQRRRRVFVVGCLGDWRSAAAVLFERHSLQGNPAPSREAGKEVAGTIAKCSFSGGAGGRPEGAAGNHFVTARMVAFGEYVDDGTASSMKSRDYKDATDLVCSIAYGLPGNWIGRAPENGGNATAPMVDLSPNLTSTDRHAVAYGIDYENNGFPIDGSCGPLMRGSPTGGGHPLPAVQTDMQVRRLTPVECSRLQGFPDDYLSQVTWRGKSPPPDGPMYKALGNSMAVPCMKYIGERIQMVEDIKNET